MHKPWHSLVFGLLVCSGLGLLSLFFPKKGFAITPQLVLNFPDPRSLLSDSRTKTDITKILDAADAAELINDAQNQEDTSFMIEGAPKRRLAKDSVVTLITGIQKRDPAALNKFYSALQELKKDPGQTFHVLHYGDSQIEGDRITDYLRLKWQTQFGGGGSGLLSLMPLTQSIINSLNVGPNWDRYNVF